MVTPKAKGKTADTANDAETRRYRRALDALVEKLKEDRYILAAVLMIGSPTWLVVLPVLFLCVLLHELGHSLAARRSIEPLWLVEKRTIEAAIEACDGNINLAAGLLEVAPSTLYRKRQSWADET